MRASDAPSGLSVRVDRHRFGGLALREWRTTIDAGPADAAGRVDVVLLHGLGVTSAYFEPLALQLAAAGTVWMLDLPGFAGVPRPDHALGVDAYAGVVLSWLDRRGLEAPLLLGHSMGAQIAVEVMARRPGVARGAVLVGPPVNVEERSAVRQAVRLAQSSWYESRDTLGVALRGYVRCGPAWFRSVLPRMLVYPIEERIAQVPVPLLIVRGEHDAVSPRAWVQRLVDAAPDARWVEVAGAGHAVIYDHRDEMAGLVLAHARQ
jgi:pimeloyl-ACP methyl ester carboxylesterase